MDMKLDTMACIEINPSYRAVKFTKSLIDGYDCATAFCGMLDTKCEDCNWNTKTPYIMIDDEKVFVTRVCDYPCTGFNLGDEFYILRDETFGVTKFLSKSEFKSRYEYI